MSSSTPIRFLLDENIRIELARFLSERGINYLTAKKASRDKNLARISLTDDRVVVTNDIDFAKMCKGEVFGVVWLRLPQNDPKLLLKKFAEMLGGTIRFKDSLVILERDKHRVTPLFTRVRLSKNS